MSPYRFVDWITQGFLILIALLVLFWNATAPRGWPVLIGAHLLLVGAIHFLIRWDARPHPPRPIRFLRQFYPVLLYTLFFRETEFINRAIGWPRLDPQLIELEHRLLGFQPSVDWMASAPWLWLSELFYLSYFSYYLMIAGIGGWLLWRNPGAFRRFIAVVSFVFYSCYFIYLFVPAVGPRLFFRETPERALYAKLYEQRLPPEPPPSVQQGPFYRLMKFIYRNFEANSAAFPSSHVAVALTTLGFSWRYLRTIRWIHAVAVLLLCLSTVYCRYHYAVDVPAGILAALILAPLGNWLYQRVDAPSPE